VGPTRRRFVGLLTAGAAGIANGLAAEHGPPLASEIRRYADPATEFPVLRLTDPKHASALPAYYCRAVARNGGSLLYASDRTGKFQAYRMDLKSGVSRQLTDDDGLAASSLTLTPDDRGLCYVSGRAIWQVNLANVRKKQIYEIPEGFEPGAGFSVSDDGLHAFLVEKRAGGFRLRVVTIASGAATTVVESAEPISDPRQRPKRDGVLFNHADGQLHVVNYDGGANQRLKLAGGGVGPALWNADGRTVAYLNYPDDRKRLNSIREFTPDSNEDRLVAPTTQFVHFGRNSDATVFVGASGSKASPYVLLLVRAVKRELTLCEHKASDARMVAPIFSPNSQRVFFQSDRHGKWAIYSMMVDRLVEETE
jgi:oligogalacturonide lyase